MAAGEHWIVNHINSNRVKTSSHESSSGAGVAHSRIERILTAWVRRWYSAGRRCLADWSSTIKIRKTGVFVDKKRKRPIFLNRALVRFMLFHFCFKPFAFVRHHHHDQPGTRRQ